MLSDVDNQYSGELTEAAAQQLQARLSSSPAFCAQQREYALFSFQGMDVNVSYFAKRRRLVVQGRGTQDFLRLMLPEALSTPGDDNAPPPPFPHISEWMRVARATTSVRWLWQAYMPMSSLLNLSCASDAETVN